MQALREGLDYVVWVALMAPHQAAATSPIGSPPSYAPVHVNVRGYLYDDAHVK